VRFGSLEADPNSKTGPVPEIQSRQ